MVLGLLISTACWASNTHIRVGMDLWPGYYPVVIAKERGQFSRRNLSVEYQTPENTDHMLQAFKLGQLDLICVSLGDAFNLLQDMPDLKIILVTDISAGGDSLLSLNKLPPKLNGLKIGTNLGGFGELFVNQFLKDYNTPLNQVELVDIEASAAAKHLYSKQLDIVHTWEPYLSQLKARGAKVIYTSRQTPGLIPDVVIAHPALLQQKPSAVTGFVNTWLDAIDWWLQHPSEGNRLLQNSLQLEDTVSLKGIKLMNRDDNLDAFRNRHSPRSLHKVVPRYIEFFQTKGFTVPATADAIIDDRHVQPALHQHK